MSGDSKYGRLYPERAVALARDVLQCVIEAGPKTAFCGRATQALANLDQFGFPPTEPLFLLRGQDDLAPKVVRLYAKEVCLSEAFGGRLTPEQVEVIHRIEESADRMEAWEPRKLPD